MKAHFALTAVALSCLLPSIGWGQGSFALANKTLPAVDAPVFNAQGLPLSGSDYWAELWGSATPDSLTPLLDVSRGNTRVFAHFLSPGYFFSGNSYLSVPTIAPFGYAWLQVRVWDGRLGSTYEQAAALGIGGYGESPLFYAQGGDPFDQFPMPGRLVGLQSFSLLPVVPEPSTWALLALGGTVLWAFQQKSQGRPAKDESAS